MFSLPLQFLGIRNMFKIKKIKCKMCSKVIEEVVESIFTIKPMASGASQICEVCSSKNSTKAHNRRYLLMLVPSYKSGYVFGIYDSTIYGDKAIYTYIDTTVTVSLELVKERIEISKEKIQEIAPDYSDRDLVLYLNKSELIDTLLAATKPYKQDKKKTHITTPSVAAYYYTTTSTRASTW